MSAHRKSVLATLLFAFLIVFGSQSARAQQPAEPPAVAPPVQPLQLPDVGELFGPARLTNTMALFLLMTVLTLAPAIVIMTTSFVRIIIVLSITRQALGTQSLPPSTVLTSIAIFMTFHIMQPVFSSMYQEAVVPYTEGRINADQLVHGMVDPLRDFMATQIEHTGNHDDIWLFMDFRPDMDPDSVRTYDDVPLSVLLPAFLLSEIRTGFLIGFQIFLPFLVIDMAISSILVSMGMMMLPPVLISLPFKLLLFVLVDGWTLIAGMLLTSFTPLHPLSAAAIPP